LEATTPMPKYGKHQIEVLVTIISSFTLSIQEEPKLELKELPTHLRYAHLSENSTLSVIVSSSLTGDEEEKLLRILQDHKTTMGWTIADIKGISPSVCMHKILMEDIYKSSVQPQHRLNPTMKEVVRKEVFKLLDAGMIYVISDSNWASPVQIVPKKRSITVVKNDNNELIPIRTTTWWRVCMDYRILNKATCKYHFHYLSLIKCWRDFQAMHIIIF